MLVETVFGAKTALVKAEEELAALRELIDKRDATLVKTVEKNNEALVDAIAAKVKPPKDASLILRIEAMEEAILQLAQKLADLPGQVREDLETSAVAVGDRVAEESAALLAELREDQVEVVQTLAGMTETQVNDLKQILSMNARNIIDTTQSTAEQMVEHLTGYLLRRDDQLHRVRDQRLIDLFAKLGDALGRSNRRKLIKALGEERGLSAPPPPPPAEPTPPQVSRSFRPPSGVTPKPMPPPGPGPSGSGPFASAQRGSPLGRSDPSNFFRQEQRPPIPGSQFGPTPPQEPGDPGATELAAKPLSRAELARDYLIDPRSTEVASASPSPDDRPRSDPGRSKPDSPKSRRKP